MKAEETTFFSSFFFFCGTFSPPAPLKKNVQFSHGLTIPHVHIHACTHRHTQVHTHTHTPLPGPRSDTGIRSNRQLSRAAPLDAEDEAEPRRKANFNLKQFPEKILSPGQWQKLNTPCISLRGKQRWSILITRSVYTDWLNNDDQDEAKGKIHQWLDRENR